MNIVSENPVMVFKKEGQYGAMYSIGISKKKEDGTYENGYIPCKFRKDVNIEDRTNIYIKKAWLSFYKDKDKKTNVYIFINEFTKVEETINKSKEDSLDKAVNEFAEEIQVTGDMLPF